jgi:urease accessory protein
MAVTFVKTATVMATLPSPDPMALIRLLQLVSPGLPTGAFSYSQGLEWAVAEGWVHDRLSLGEWLGEVLRQGLGFVDIPILGLMHRACGKGDLGALSAQCDLLLACRESREFLDEEGQRGRAMAVLLAGLGMVADGQWQKVLARSQLAGFAYAAQTWGIEPHLAAVGYLFSWLENQILTGVKIIPLGQTAGQQLLLELSGALEVVALRGLALDEEEIGASAPALALASMRHEYQYTRLYRS